LGKKEGTDNVKMAGAMWSGGWDCQREGTTSERTKKAMPNE